jgi:anti-sigma regulatory factor (Ser/Thr protein kinase)
MEVRLLSRDVPQWTVPITEASQIADARRRTATLARELEFTETRAGALAIVLTEMGTNLVKHAQGGEIIVRAFEEAGGKGIEVLSVDRGPGIGDLGECLRDGYSSAGTQGTGLGAIRRQADEFDIHSVVGRGTVILARLFAEEHQRPSSPLRPPGSFDIGVVGLPVRGEELSGDSWDLKPSALGFRFLIVDGVGHGPDAAAASAQALRILQASVDWTLMELMERMHDGLRSGRGAVAAVAELSRGDDTVRFAGVGNISGVLWSAQRPQNMVSMNGTLGHGVIRVREFSYAWPPDALLILHSDGLGTRWNLDDYPGLASRTAPVVAAVLYRDFTRGRDDVTVLVVRRRPSRP